MGISKILASTLVLTATFTGVAVPFAEAIQLANGTVAFVKSPHLIAASTTFNEAYAWGATYYFTVELPENIGEPLGMVKIQQREGFETIRFNLEESLVFEGKHRNKGDKLAIAEVTEDKETKTISLTFDPPISPGKTVTIGLRPVRNPIDGIYLFGVAAFPAGEKPYGLYLGVGRLHFYDDFDRHFPFIDLWR